MKGVKILYICSLIALVAAGILFVQMHRQAKVVGVIENLKDKTIVFYSSNSGRSYVDYKDKSVGAMDMLCIEAMSQMKSDGFDAVNYKIEAEMQTRIPNRVFTSMKTLKKIMNMF
jgi:hypothetical protein